jgi:hypothetical protein
LQAFLRCGRMTLVLFRTRRWDECSSLKEGGRRRVRKSRQKEAAGPADAEPMQIAWSEGGCKGSLEPSMPVKEKAAHLRKGESVTEVGLGGDSKRMFGCKEDILRRDALKRADSAVCERVISCGCGQEWWRTELELCDGESFDHGHRSAALGTAP